MLGKATSDEPLAPMVELEPETGPDPCLALPGPVFDGVPWRIWTRILSRSRSIVKVLLESVFSDTRGKSDEFELRS